MPVAANEISAATATKKAAAVKGKSASASDKTAMTKAETTGATEQTLASPTAEKEAPSLSLKTTAAVTTTVDSSPSAMSNTPTTTKEADRVVAKSTGAAEAPTPTVDAKIAGTAETYTLVADTKCPPAAGPAENEPKAPPKSTTTENGNRTDSATNPAVGAAVQEQQQSENNDRVVKDLSPTQLPIDTTTVGVPAAATFTAATAPFRAPSPTVSAPADKEDVVMVEPEGKKEEVRLQGDSSADGKTVDEILMDKSGTTAAGILLSNDVPKSDIPTHEAGPSNTAASTAPDDKDVVVGKEKMTTVAAVSTGCKGKAAAAEKTDDSNSVEGKTAVDTKPEADMKTETSAQVEGKKTADVEVLETPLVKTEDETQKLSSADAADMKTTVERKETTVQKQQSAGEMPAENGKKVATEDPADSPLSKKSRTSPSKNDESASTTTTADTASVMLSANSELAPATTVEDNP